MWRRCRMCKTWARELTKVEEREDDPPQDEMDLADSMDLMEKTRAARWAAAARKSA